MVGCLGNAFKLLSGFSGTKLPKNEWPARTRIAAYRVFIAPLPHRSRSLEGDHLLTRRHWLDVPIPLGLSRFHKLAIVSEDHVLIRVSHFQRLGVLEMRADSVASSHAVAGPS
jgi:hypothetical protein